MFGRKAANGTGSEGRMLLRSPGGGGKVKFGGSLRGAERLLWVSPEQDAEGRPVQTRKPRERTRVSPYPGGFEAAGRRYKGLEELAAEQLEDGACLDSYGRKVLCITERFPCFDSFDALYEHRFYRWYFLRVGDSLTRVYHEDESGRVYVTEDVEALEFNCWREFRRLGYAGAE